LNDAVTSYLWRCFKGEASYNPIPFTTSFDSFNLYRPFLLASKKELKEYAYKTYPVIENYVVEDELNNDLGLTRNFIREEVLPLIHTKKHFNLNKVVKRIVERNLKKFLDEKYP
jgi:tRNA(Ile)-lysidine synthase TilS/MesJ